eukprot:239983-Chlamydomonas_euryale.AAC.3
MASRRLRAPTWLACAVGCHVVHMHELGDTLHSPGLSVFGSIDRSERSDCEKSARRFDRCMSVCPPRMQRHDILLQGTAVMRAHIARAVMI